MLTCTPTVRLLQSLEGRTAEAESKMQRARTVLASPGGGLAAGLEGLQVQLGTIAAAGRALTQQGRAADAGGAPPAAVAALVGQLEQQERRFAAW